jgi:predicted DNA-binding protein (MmcQ/YjbR family)
MDIEEIREHCLKMPLVEESFPFDHNTLVFKVGGKMFLLLDINSNPIEFNVKCNPGRAIELREQYVFIQPGYHMNKTHWNTITCTGSVPKKLIFQWISDSYDLVFAGLPIKIRGAQGK